MVIQKFKKVAIIRDSKRLTGMYLEESAHEGADRWVTVLVKFQYFIHVVVAQVFSF